MRTLLKPMPKRRSFVSRKPGSIVQRREYKLMISRAVAAPLPAARCQASFMFLALTQTTAPTCCLSFE